METSKVVKLLMDKFREEYGADAKLEDGDEICGVCNNAVVLLSLEGSKIQLKVLEGEPYKLDVDLDFE